MFYASGVYLDLHICVSSHHSSFVLITLIWDIRLCSTYPKINILMNKESNLAVICFQYFTTSFLVFVNKLVVYLSFSPWKTISLYSLTTCMNFLPLVFSTLAVMCLGFLHLFTVAQENSEKLSPIFFNMCF